MDCVRRKSMPTTFNKKKKTDKQEYPLNNNSSADLTLIGRRFTVCKKKNDQKRTEKITVRNPYVNYYVLCVLAVLDLLGVCCCG